MKNKLLLSSALLGCMFSGVAANAQTSVTGSLAIGYKSFSDYKASSSSQAQRAFGRESQLNIANKGKLNNGMDYAAGFSLEFDGGQASDASNENVYLNIISGSTLVHVGFDHIQNTNRTRGNLIGNDAFDLAAGNAAGTSKFIQSAGAAPVENGMGVGIVQTTPFGSFSAFYTPNNGMVGTSDAVGHTTGTTATTNIETSRESAYEIGFVGGLGIAGLSTHAMYNKEGKEHNTYVRDLKGENYGISYARGPITAGYNFKKTQAGTSVETTKQNEFAVAYALTPTLTLGGNYTKVDSSLATSTGDAKSKSIALGYNLGPVAVSAQYVQMENVTAIAANNSADFDIAYIKMTTAF